MLDVTTIKNYVDAERTPILGKTIMGARTLDIINTQVGIKGTANINILDTAVELQDGSECGWTEAGESVLTARPISVLPLKVNQAFCEKDLLNTWMQNDLRIAAGRETLPFEERFIDDIVKNVNAKVEKLIWTGDKSNAGEFDGFLTILATESPITVSSTGVNDTVTKAYLAIPAEDLSKSTILIGEDKFREYVLEITTKNLYHYDPKVDGEMTVVMPGTSTKVIGVPGLNGTDKVIAGRMDYLVYGTDMVDDKETFKFWFSDDADEFRLKIEFLAGVQVAFPDQIVLGTIA